MAGWPWPLDAVQGWFEDLWDWILEAANTAVSAVQTWINDALTTIWSNLSIWSTWVVDSVSGILTGLSTTMGSAISGASAAIINTLSSLIDSVSREVLALPGKIGLLVAGIGQGLGDIAAIISGAIKNGLDWVVGTIWGWVDGALRWATDVFRWLFNSIAEVVANTEGAIIAGVMGAFDAASTAIGSTLMDLFGGFRDAFAEISISVVDMARGDWIPPFLDNLSNIFGTLSDMFAWLWKASSPLDPAEAWARAQSVILQVTGAWAAIHSANTFAETVTLGQVDISLDRAFDSPEMRGAMSLVSDITRSINEASLITPLRYYFNSAFTPTIPDVDIATRMYWRKNLELEDVRKIAEWRGYAPKYQDGFIELTKQIPPAPDLIRMVVREAFDPNVVVAAPDIFAEYMEKSGYLREWSDRYWTAHFLPIDLRQAYENLWRGYWDKDRFMFALHIADIHPMWREDIYKVAFRPPSARELGYGFDTGEYELADIVTYRRWAGLSPEDAERAGRAMVAYRTEAEREALRREALADYVAGLDDEPELRDKLAQIGGRPEIVELWVSRAKYRATRDLTLDLIKVVTTDFVKGWSTENSFRQALLELGVVPERRDVMIADAKARKLKYKTEETVEKKKVIPLARVRLARDLGLIGDAEYVQRLLDHDYTEEDARLDLAIELTPRPVTPEELERRRLTIESRKARAARRWETRLARVQDEIDLTALQLSDTTTLMSEALDVIDAQISVYDQQIAEATPERVPVLEERRTVLLQRRELTEATWTSRIAKLTAQQSDLIEEKALMEKQRDEELGEYDQELALLGMVAG